MILPGGVDKLSSVHFEHPAFWLLPMRPEVQPLGHQIQISICAHGESGSETWTELHSHLLKRKLHRNDEAWLSTEQDAATARITIETKPQTPGPAWPGLKQTLKLELKRPSPSFLSPASKGSKPPTAWKTRRDKHRLRDSDSAFHFPRSRPVLFHILTAIDDEGEAVGLFDTFLTFPSAFFCL